MQDLTGKYAARLTPTSQEGGGMVYDNTPAMTAPGSAPVTPMMTPYGAKIPFETPDDIPSDSKKIAVSSQAARTGGNPPPADNHSGGGWMNTDDTPAAGVWKKV